MDRDTYTNVATADYINQHFVSIKVDFDLAPELVAQLQRAQALLNLPGCHSYPSSHQRESSILARDTCRPSERRANRHFERQRKKLRTVTPIKPRSMKNPFNWRLPGNREDNYPVVVVIASLSVYSVCNR
jgi:Protein of unknown function, DUF255